MDTARVGVFQSNLWVEGCRIRSEGDTVFGLLISIPLRNINEAAGHVHLTLAVSFFISVLVFFFIFNAAG